MRVSSRVAPIAVDEAVGQVIAHRAQHRFALAQPFLVGDACRDVRPNAVPEGLSVRPSLRARPQPHPAHCAILAPDRGLHGEIAHVAHGRPFSLNELWKIFGQDLRVQRVCVGHRLLDRNPGELFNAGADVKKSRVPFPIAGILIDDAVGQVIADRPQGRLALAQSFLVGDIVRNVFGINDNAADRAIRAAPRLQPAPQPLHAPVRAYETRTIFADDLAGQGPAIQIFPMRIDLGKNIIERPSNAISVDAENALPATARRKIAHIPIEHCRAGRSLRYQLAQLRLFQRGRATSAVAILPIEARIGDDTQASVYLIGAKTP